MQFSNALDDGKAEPGTAGLVAIAPPEPLKNKITLVFGDARSVVEYADRAIPVDNEFDGRAGRSVIDGVFGEIANRPAEHFRIAFDPDRFGRAEQGDILALRQRQRRHELRDLRG